jgi:hypothetical protein
MDRLFKRFVRNLYKTCNIYSPSKSAGSCATLYFNTYSYRANYTLWCGAMWRKSNLKFLLYWYTEGLSVPYNHSAGTVTYKTSLYIREYGELKWSFVFVLIINMGFNKSLIIKTHWRLMPYNTYLYMGISHDFNTLYKGRNRRHNSKHSKRRSL